VPNEGLADRPGYRPYRVAVQARESLNERFTRVTFTGPDLHDFGPGGLDQRVKLVLPLRGGGLPDVGADDPEAIAAGSWYARWRALPAERRSPFRTYTARAARPDRREFDVDFVEHGDGGPAARWLAGATVGDELLVIGPDAGSIHGTTGIDWHPGAATEVLLAGDETAVPAIGGIVEALPPAVRATVLVETPSVRDALPLRGPERLDLRWVARDPAAPGGRLRALLHDWLHERADVVAAARSGAPQPLSDVDVDAELLWESPPGTAAGPFYAWLAGESAMIKDLRRLLVTEHDVDRARVAFMGYWRRGRAELQ
jgi:NADPH-dependent ferric siderophore reductase